MRLIKDDAKIHIHGMRNKSLCNEEFHVSKIYNGDCKEVNCVRCLTTYQYIKRAD